MDNLMEIIKGRRSVRTFDGSRIADEDIKKLSDYAADIVNPFDLPVEFIFLDANDPRIEAPGNTEYIATVKTLG